MTRNDHDRRVLWVLRKAREAVDLGRDINWLSRKTNIPVKVIPRYLRRHRADDLVEALTRRH